MGLSDHLKMLSKHPQSGVFTIMSYAKRSFIIAKIPVITNNILSSICRIDLNQEAIPEGRQLKILNNREVSVSTVLNHLVCARISSSSISISLEVF